MIPVLPLRTLAWAFLTFPLGCSSPPPPTAAPRLEIVLPPPSDTDAQPPARDQARSRELDVTVDVPDGAWLAEPALVLPGFTGAGQVVVGDLDPIDVFGGPGGAIIDLPGMKPGPVRIQLRLHPAESLDPVLVGGDGIRTPPLRSPPVLLLRPSAHVDDLALVDQGRTVQARATVDGAPREARVRFVVVLDGEIVQDLGTAPIVDGVATSAPQVWQSERWTPGAPNLYLLFAVLQDEDGTELDRKAQRTGARQVLVTDTGFAVGGEALQVVATRPHSPMDTDVVADALAAGANALEFHGTPPSTATLRAMDEVGLLAVLTPRCEGAMRLRRSDAEIRAAVTRQHEALRSQNERLTWAMAGHPSVALWITEAVTYPQLPRMLAEADPQGRPVVGHQLPLSAVMAGTQLQLPREPGSFIFESAWNGPAGESEVLAQAFQRAMAAGARGGVIEHVQQDSEVQVWQRAVAELHVAPVRPGGRRSRSTLTVQGATPTAVAWLSGAWVPPVGAVTGPDGQAVLEVWHEGPAVLHLGPTEQAVTLAASEWTAEGARSGGSTIRALD